MEVFRRENYPIYMYVWSKPGAESWFLLLRECFDNSDHRLSANQALVSPKVRLIQFHKISLIIYKISIIYSKIFHNKKINQIFSKKNTFDNFFAQEKQTTKWQQFMRILSVSHCPHFLQRCRLSSFISKNDSSLTWLAKFLW